MVLKALGLYSLQCIAYDIIKECIETGRNYEDQTTLKKMPSSLKFFDWTTQTSLLLKLGGMKGVNEAHQILLEALLKS